MFLSVEQGKFGGVGRAYLRVTPFCGLLGFGALFGGIYVGFTSVLECEALGEPPPLAASFRLVRWG